LRWEENAYRRGRKNDREAPTEAGKSGVNHAVHESAPGATPASDSVTARNNGCSFLKCRIADVGRTYLWSWSLGAERHGRNWDIARWEPRHPLTGGRGVEDERKSIQVERTGTRRERPCVDNRVNRVGSWGNTYDFIESTTSDVLDRVQCCS
jgi:hypothetical protein